MNYETLKVHISYLTIGLRVHCLSIQWANCERNMLKSTNLPKFPLYVSNYSKPLNSHLFMFIYSFPIITYVYQIWEWPFPVSLYSIFWNKHFLLQLEFFIRIIISKLMLNFEHSHGRKMAITELNCWGFNK